MFSRVASSLAAFARMTVPVSIVTGSALLSVSLAMTPTSSTTLNADSKERTYIMLKPDAVNRRLIGEILSRFEKRGYNVVGLKVLTPSRELAEAHYAEHKERPFFKGLVDFLTSGPVVAIVIEGDNAVATARTMIGVTKPQASAPGTIRGDLSIDVGRNIIHGSDSVESARREIGLWFRPVEIVDFKPVDHAWVYEK
ncbi:mitochondrial nucleoside-diphosphate kinase [Andalucia godoyi]|uniref:Nucleoside diphosphate kinase n=1 Tax=Andalucia godoyi TaxID=505711 RepID=A0A8K0F4N5_ANDGO|nr:mitochondrial nucleoside-diphosphate kinase [Andalucia godoyi]|eukprot:ANDGO_02296.mRNA.1 mitochondrial nucleoside-diphosphate kinase